MINGLKAKVKGLFNKEAQVEEVTALQHAEKDQTNTLIGIIYILAIAVAIGTLFLMAFPELGQTIVDALNAAFGDLVGNVPWS